MVSTTNIRLTHCLTIGPVFILEPMMPPAIPVAVLDTVDALNGFSPIWNQKKNCRLGPMENTRGQAQGTVDRGVVPPEDAQLTGWVALLYCRNAEGAWKLLFAVDSMPLHGTPAVSFPVKETVLT
ncbi:MAG: hypothetical protein OXC69_10335 [Candidatus Tectomicrobia bacterium]|nr:hypothetical protein [Candidatus Tectomicrobia bacterium]